MIVAAGALPPDGIAVSEICPPVTTAGGATAVVSDGLAVMMADSPGSPQAPLTGALVASPP